MTSRDSERMRNGVVHDHPPDVVEGNLADGDPTHLEGTTPRKGMYPRGEKADGYPA